MYAACVSVKVKQYLNKHSDDEERLKYNSTEQISVEIKIKKLHTPLYGL